MAIQALTKILVDKLSPTAKPYFVWDTKLKGFGMKVLPSGRKLYVAQYRPRSSRASRRVSLGPHGTLTADQARRMAQELLGSVAAGQDPAGQNRAAREAPTLAELAPRYFERQATLRSKRTAHWTKGLFTKYILPRLGSRRVAELSTQDVAKLHQRMSHTPIQANRVLAVLSSFSSWAEKEGFRSSGTNPCRAVDRYKERKREYFLAGEELAKLGEVLRSAEATGAAQAQGLDIDRDAIAIIRLLLLTGCRKSEILGLKWAEVDPARGLLLLGETKTGKSVRPLNAPAREVLARLQRHETSEYVFPGTDPQSPRADITSAWNRIRVAAGLQHVRLHDLRHTYASVAVSGGSSLPLIGGLLGHTQASTTQRYAHLANDPLALAAERAGADMAAALSGHDTPVTPLHRRATG